MRGRPRNDAPSGRAAEILAARALPGAEDVDVARQFGVSIQAVAQLRYRYAPNVKPRGKYTSTRTAPPAWDVLASKFTYAPSGCWTWNGPVGNHGYGRIARRGFATTLAHRLVYIELVGPVDPQLVLDHLCRNTICVNPGHLEEVSSEENFRRGVRTGRRKDKPRENFRCGHQRLGARRCRTCRRAWEAKRRAAAKVSK